MIYLRKNPDHIPNKIINQNPEALKPWTAELPVI